MARLRAGAEATGWVREDGVGAYGPQWTWCAEPDPNVGCLGRSVQPGAGWRVLEEGRWEAAEFPADGWGAQLVVQEPDWSLRLVRLANGNVTDQIDLGRTLTLTVEITDIQVDGGELSGLGDPRTVGSAACTDITAIYDAALAQLGAGGVQRCHYGRYHGDGSILCRPIPLPAPEVLSYQAELRRDKDRHCRQVHDDAAEIAALVHRLWPG